MEKATAYINEIRSKHYENDLSNNCDEHNLRLTNKADYDPNLSHNNSYLIDIKGELKPVPSTPNNMEKIKKHIDKITNRELAEFFKETELEEAKTQTSRNKLSNEKAQLKLKFKNWINNDKTPEEEREIFSKILIELEDNKPFNEQHKEAFKAITSKITKRNDKLRAIEKVSSFDSWNATAKRNGLERKIKTVEVLFKIPDRNNVNVKKEHWQQFAKAFLKQFPNNTLLYSAVHMDENPQNPHLHLKFSGYNKETNNYDYPDQCMKLLAKKLGKDYPFSNKKWCELNEEELTRHGELMQDFYFDCMNKFLNKKGYQVEVKKRTLEEKKEAAHDYSNNKKRMTSREHNRQNKLNKENETQEQKLKDIKQERNKEQRRINKMKNQTRQIEEELKTKTELKEKLEGDFYKLLKIPKMIIQSFKNLIDIYRSDQPEMVQDAQAAEENKRFKNEFNQNIDGLNIEDETVKNEVSNTIDETSNLIEGIQQGTEAELLAMEQTKKNTNRLKSTLTR